VIFSCSVASASSSAAQFSFGQLRLKMKQRTRKVWTLKELAKVINDLPPILKSALKRGLNCHNLIAISAEFITHNNITEYATHLESVIVNV
jgi:hypothetical protein